MKKQVPAVKTSIEAKPADSPVVATNRTVLPPMDVEVVAGDSHRTVRPGTNAAKVEIPRAQSAVPAQAASSLAGATNAAERERMSIETNAAPPSYPLLAQHMNVKGAVVLHAVIGADGMIENLRVLSGPAILSSAAQQAVREWRFKPVLQNGQPVETQAKITVNFTINVADGAGPTLAQTHTDSIQVLSR